MSSFNAEDANNAENAELTSIEELTRHMQDLTDADKSDADLIELAETAKETLESSVVAVERSEVAGTERAETAQEAVTGNTEDKPIDTIQVRACTSAHVRTLLRISSVFSSSPTSQPHTTSRAPLSRTCKRRSTSFWRRFASRARRLPSDGRPPRRWRRRSSWSGRSWKRTLKLIHRRRGRRRRLVGERGSGPPAPLLLEARIRQGLLSV